MAAGNVSTVAFIVGGVGLAAGTVLWLALPSKADQTGQANQFRIGLGRGVTLEHTWEPARPTAVADAASVVQLSRRQRRRPARAR